MSREIILNIPQIIGGIYPRHTSCAPWMRFLWPLPPALGCWAWLWGVGLGSPWQGMGQHLWVHPRSGASSCPPLWPGGISGL